MATKRNPVQDVSDLLGQGAKLTKGLTRGIGLGFSHGLHQSLRLFHKRHTHVGASPGTLIVPAEAPPPQISLIRYNEDELVERSIAQVSEIEQELGRGGICWVDVHGLGDETVLRELGELFAIHPLALEAVVNVPQRPKAEPYEKNTLVIARMAQLLGPNHLDIEQASILIGNNHIVTFQERPGDVLEPIRKRLRGGKGLIRQLGSDYLGYAILDTIVDAYYPLLEQLGDTIESFEEEVTSGSSERVLVRLTVFKRMLLLLRRAIWPQRDAVNTLIRDPDPRIGDTVRVYLRDTHDHAVQAAEVNEAYRELVNGLMNTYLTVVANRTNEIMRVLTVMASIFIPLTFLAGIYGMNFEHMPELKQRWAYPVLLGVMLAIGAGLLWYFRRVGWLGRRRGS